MKQLTVIAFLLAALVAVTARAQPDEETPPLILSQKQRGPPCTLGWNWGTRRMIVPLKDVSIKARVETGLTRTQVDLTYSNLLSDVPIEVEFSYPMVNDQVVQSFSAVIGSRTVVATIKNKEVAKVEYEEGKAKGKGVIYAERETDNDNEFLKLKLGNLRPGQDAVITIKLIESATELIGGAYSYRVPSKYFPRYKIKGDKRGLPYPEYDPNVYTFQYKVDLAAPKGKMINYISSPSFADYTEQIGRTLVTIKEPQSDMPPTKDILIFYKTTDMMLTPNLFVERDPKHPFQVAVGATFAPSFDNRIDDEYFEIVSDEEPEKLPVDGKDFHFVFILDRSGSMEGENIVVARKALQLFIQSLPVGCKFSLISFGDRWELHKNFGGELQNDDGTFNYTDQSLAEAVEAIGKFQADFGGTELDQPIKAAREILDKKQFAKNARIFVLTDGQVYDRDNVYQQVEDLPAHLRISTFGIGKSFDEELVSRVAKKGRGSVSRIYDLDQGSLSAAAVLALNRAMYPSLPGCNITWTGQKTENLNEVFYNQLISSYRIFNASDFDNNKISFTFQCKESPDSDTPLQQTFFANDFRQVPAKSGFFKMAARHLVKRTTDSNKREKISLRYQVLAPETAFVGVVKEEGRLIEETIKVEIGAATPVEEFIEEEDEDVMAGWVRPQPIRKSIQPPYQPSPMVYEIEAEEEPMDEGMEDFEDAQWGDSPEYYAEDGDMAEEGADWDSSPQPPACDKKCEAERLIREAKEQAEEKRMQIERERKRKEAARAKKEAARARKEAHKKAREQSEARKKGRPQFEELTDVWYQSASGGWKDSAKFMIGRFFEGGLPANESSHDETVWLNLLALYILDMEFSSEERQWVLMAEKAKGMLKRKGVNVSRELGNLYYDLVD